MAGGSKVLEALHETYPEQQLRGLLEDGRKGELGEKCEWSQVRVDRKSDTGFMVLSAMNGKLLVCHDMKGGYQEDRFKQGCDDFDAYRFYQWDLVDLFVYFGHALVYPPPTVWIAAGHRHGTRVLGTFLTEGDEGTELCKELFQNADSAETFASKLAAIARHGGFDGWLVNVENDVPTELVANIDVFLRTLRKGMQLQNPLAQVVWYGSLSRSGKRTSYVRLDESSTDFFRNVDAFYVDYGWTPDDAKFSAAFDLDRRYDIYMGIDVFGRHNMLGGGKMNCGEPLRLAWNAGVSAALFAPGGLMNATSMRSNKTLSLSRTASGNCLYTAFNIGRGVSVWTEGKRVGTSPWSNMTELDIQPDQALHVGNIVTTATGSMKAVISHDTAFQGEIYFKLYDVDIEFSPRRIMEISYTTATREESVCLLVLTVCPGLDRATHYVILRSMDDSGPDSGDSRVDPKKSFDKPAVKAAHRDVRSKPKCCENARIVSFKRDNAQSVSFGVQWDFTTDGEPVRYVLAFACIEDGERFSW
ncbi:Cytosolic endo-beta-N-acetylglucosaminidase [Phytophthora cactorum]|nr:Cytosolic endo-beta-N-acetylglucosaminidase [Phytophthora cactorum]